MIPMKALKAFRNREYEGEVVEQQEFVTTEDRARELERGELAVRIVSLAPPVPVEPSVPARPLASGDNGESAQPSSSPVAPAPRTKTSGKSKVRAQKSSA